MADVEILGLEDGAVAAAVVNGPPAADVELQAQLDEAAQVLLQRGQTSLVELALGLVRFRLQLDTAMCLLGDGVRRVLVVEGDPALFDEFRHSIRGHILNLQEAGNNEAFPLMVLEAAHQYAARLVLSYGETTQQQPYGNGGFVGVVPASAAAVRSLEKQTFRAAGGSDDGVAECSICLKEFVDGGQVSVMPCPSRGHKFHPDCIAKWLGISNMCPLCRHELPAY
jgi:hypothetical protein